MRTERKVLRRFVLVAAASAALVMGTSPAYADNGPHVSTATNESTLVGGVGTNGVKISDAGQGRCASCHRAHTAKAAYLLNATSEESLCFSCHGDGGTGATTDVQGGVAYGATASTGITLTRDGTMVGALRGGGFEQAMLGASEATKDIGTLGAHGWTSVNQLIPPAPQQEVTTSNHFGGVAIMWGNGPLSATPNLGKNIADFTEKTKLECSSCHDPHGNGQYRILKPVPSDSGFTAKIGTNTEAGIFIPDTKNKVYTTANYWKAGDTNVLPEELTNTTLGATSILDPTPKATTGTLAVDPYLANVAAWCTTCHTRYLAPRSSWKTDSGDPVFTYRHTGDNVSSDGRNRNCIQCHVAHGSNAVMPNSSVEWPSADDPATSTAPKSDDSRLLRVDDRGVCVMCHNV